VRVEREVYIGKLFAEMFDKCCNTIHVFPSAGCAQFAVMEHLLHCSINDVAKRVLRIDHDEMNSFVHWMDKCVNSFC
jgi:hypothetical protein